jgi:hypothetical protein
MKAKILLITLVILATPFSARTQTLATMTTGAIASDGEGGLFMLAGTDVTRFGLNSRFALAADFDMGLQLVFDRLDERSFFGGGIDVKYRLPIKTSDLPIDVALDAGFGDLESSEIRRLFLEMGCIISGVVESSNRRILEPYVGIYVMTTRRDWKDDCGENDHGCWEGTRSDTDAVLRGGIRANLTDDFQIIVELNVNGKTMFGAGVNLIF